VGFGWQECTDGSGQYSGCYRVAVSVLCLHWDGTLRWGHPPSHVGLGDMVPSFMGYSKDEPYYES